MSAPKKKTSGSPILYWHLGCEGIAFIDGEDWQERDALYHPGEYGITWAWFKERYPKLWDLILERSEEEQELDPDFQNPPLSEDETFDIERVPGFNEGDFPPWEQADGVCPVPEEICDRYGELRSSVVNGPFMYFPPEKKEAIFHALRRLGYSVRKRP